MKNIRIGVFETNSSSTHSICIPINAVHNIVDSVHFALDEWGWEHGMLRTLDQKAAYLYTAIVELKGQDSDHLKSVIAILESKGVKCTTETPDDNKDYGIDHSSDLMDFIEQISFSEELLFDYLFSNETVIITGNDNCETSVKETANSIINGSKHPFIVYHKWN